MGELAALGAAFLWASASLMFARAGRTTGPVALNFVKTLLGLLMLAATVFVIHGTLLPTAIDPASLGWLAFSGVVGLTVGDSAFFAAINRLGARRAMLLWALVPPTTALLAWPILDEVFGPWAVAGVTVTLLGIVWVLRERGAGSEASAVWPGLGFGLVAVVCQSVGSVTAKLGGAQLDAVTLTMVRLAFGTAGLMLQVFGARAFAEIRALIVNPRALLLVAAATTLATYLGLWLSMAALQLTLAGIAATLTSTSPIFVLPLTRIFTGEHVSRRAVGGAVVAVAGVAILLLR